jgi:hypothetical protein
MSSTNRAPDSIEFSPDAMASVERIARDSGQSPKAIVTQIVQTMIANGEIKVHGDTVEIYAGKPR